MLQRYLKKSAQIYEIYTQKSIQQQPLGFDIMKLDMNDETQASINQNPGIKIEDIWYGWNRRVNEATIIKTSLHKKIYKTLKVTTVALFILLVSFDLISSVFFNESSYVYMYGAVLTVLFYIALSFYKKKQAAFIPQRVYEDKIGSIEPVDKEMLVNIGAMMQPGAMHIVEEAFKLARRFEHKEVTSLHIFISSMSTKSNAVVFGRLGVRFDQLRGSLNRELATFSKGVETRFGEKVQCICVSAFIKSFKQNRKTISPTMLMQEAFLDNAFIQDLLNDLGVNQEKFIHMIEWVNMNEGLQKRYSDFRNAGLYKRLLSFGKFKQEKQTPVLDQISIDLTKQGEFGNLPFLVGRDKELDALFSVLESGGRSAVLIGSPGVGKQAIIAGVAERMVEDRVPDFLKNKRLVQISLPDLISDQNPKDFEKQFADIIYEVQASNKIILVIHHIDMLLEHESYDGMLRLFSETFSHGTIPVIVTTTPKAYQTKIEPSVFGHLLAPIQVEEPNIATSIHVLESRIEDIMREYQVVFSYEAIEQCVILSDRYIHGSYLPDKAIDLAGDVAAACHQNTGSNTLITGHQVAKVVSDKINAPIFSKEVAGEIPFEAGRDLGQYIIGQKKALTAVSDIMKRSLSMLPDNHGPIASFLFIGPNGVGKTELAKTISEQYFGGEKNLIQFDLSEYQSSYSVKKLVGESDGENGLLTEKIQNFPFTVILLDDFEKAHPDVHKLFSQILNQGFVKSTSGEKIDFTNTIIIATSDSGMKYQQAASKEGVSYDEMYERMIKEELHPVYTDTLIGLFDGVILFETITMEQMNQIARMFLDEVKDRLDTKGIFFSVQDDAIAELAEKGYDPQFGALPLRRLIHEHVEVLIDKKLSKKSFSVGDIVLLKKGGKIEFKKGAKL